MTTSSTSPLSPRLKVLVIDEVLPYPPNSGKRIRTFELLRRLARDHEIALVYPRRGEDSPESEAAVRAAGIRLVPVDLPPIRKSGARFAWDLFRNLLTSKPYSALVHGSAAVRAAVAADAAASPPDLVHVEWTPLVVNVPPDIAAPVCVSAHNVEAGIWERTVKAQRSFARRAYARFEARKVARFEQEALSRADEVLAVSEHDAERIRTWAGAAHVTVVPNGVDTRAFSPRPEAAVDPDGTLFVGSLDWRPNQDAVIWYAEEILPLVRQKRRNTTFHVVGRHPPAWLVERLSTTFGAHLWPSVPDVRPFVARAALSVVPLRVGGGSRLKICEALAMERPVVSTTVGAEGLDLGDGVRIADGAAAFAAAVAEALDDPQAAAASARRGRTRVLSSNDWDVIAPLQAEAWRQLVARGRRAARA